MSNRIVSFLSAITRFFMRIYDSFSNRGLSVLILFLAAIGSIVGIWWYFGAGVSGLQIQLQNASGATVELKKAGSTLYSVQCETNCSIRSIAPVQYDLVIRSEGFREYSEVIEFHANEIISRSITLNRNVELGEYRTDASEVKDKVAIRKVQDELLSLPIELGSGKYTGEREIIGNNGQEVFALLTEPPVRLVARNKGVNSVIMEFPYSASGVVYVWNPFDTLAVFDTGKERISFDGKTKKIQYTKLPTGITKIARLSDGMIGFVTEEGAYLQNADGSFFKHPFYDDFSIIEPSGVLALIRGSSHDKKKLLNMNDDGNDSILLDTGAGIRETLLSVDANIVSLDRNGEMYFATDSEGKKYILKNLTK